MSKDKELNKNPVIEVDGQKFILDFSDLDGLEWREVKKHTGMNAAAAIQAAGQLDFEVLGVITWCIVKRDKPDIQLEDVLRNLNLRSLNNFGDEEEVPKD